MKTGRGAGLMVDVAVGGVLREWRKQNKLSQTEMAKMIGNVSECTIGNIEKGIPISGPYYDQVRRWWKDHLSKNNELDAITKRIEARREELKNAPPVIEPMQVEEVQAPAVVTHPVTVETSHGELAELRRLVREQAALVNNLVALQTAHNKPMVPAKRRWWQFGRSAQQGVAG